MRRVTQPFIYNPPPTPIPAIYRHVAHKQRCTSVWHSNCCIVLASVKPDTLCKSVHRPSDSHSFSLNSPKLSLGSPATPVAAQMSLCQYVTSDTGKAVRVVKRTWMYWLCLYSPQTWATTNCPMLKEVRWHGRCCGAFWSAWFGSLGQPSFFPFPILSQFSRCFEIWWIPYLKHHVLEIPLASCSHTVALAHTPLFVQSSSACSFSTWMINLSWSENNLHPFQGVVLFVVTTLHVWFQIQPMWAVTCEAPPPGWLPASPKVRESNKKPCCPPPSMPKLSVRVPLGDVPRKWLWWVAVAAAAIFSGLAARRGEEGNV